MENREIRGQRNEIIYLSIQDTKIQITTPMQKSKKVIAINNPSQMTMGVLAGLLWLLGIGWLGYFVQQTQFYAILGGYALAFGAFGWLMGMPREALPAKFMIILAVLGRLLLAGSEPLLSNDIYRFLWDGLRWLDGANAYVGTPTQVITLFARDPSYAHLFTLLNSPDYYSVYPPLLQVLFIPAAAVWRARIPGDSRTDPASFHAGSRSGNLDRHEATKGAGPPPVVVFSESPDRRGNIWEPACRRDHGRFPGHESGMAGPT